MKVIKPAYDAINNDFTFLLNGNDVGRLIYEPLIGEVFMENHGPPSPERPLYINICESITLAIDDVRPVAGGGANSDRPYFHEFWIRSDVYRRLNENGYVPGIRYDLDQGSKMDLINYEFKRNWNFHISTLIRDLKLNV